MLRALPLLAFVAVASAPASAEPESANSVCERVVSHMLKAETWHDIYVRSGAVPERCIDGIFAEEISDVFVTRLHDDWDSFMQVIKDNPENTWFFGMVVKRINATLDRKDVAFVDHFAKTHCDPALQTQCASIRKQVQATLNEIDEYRK